MLAATIAERDDAAEVTTTRFLVSLDLPNPFADAVALGLSEGRRDGQERFENPLPEYPRLGRAGAD